MGREYPEKPIAGVVAIVFKEDSVLLVRRGNEPGRGRWGFPGGVVELGETVREAVVREAMEESGLRVEPVELVAVYDSITRDDDGYIRFHYILSEFLCRVVGGSLRPSSDVSDARWFRLDELDTIDISERTTLFLRRLSSRVLVSDRSY